MNDDISGGTSKAEAGKDWGRLRQVSDEEARAAVAADPDVRPIDAAFWEGDRVVPPRRKETITIRLDADLLAWLRRELGHQTRINALLRAYMAAGGERCELIGGAA
jgi:uncharacterized protein (DUF4415 family)